MEKRKNTEEQMKSDAEQYRNNAVKLLNEITDVSSLKMIFGFIKGLYDEKKAGK